MACNWRYVIVTATFVTFLCNTSMLYSNGVVFMALRESGRYHITSLAWLFAVSDMLHAFGGPIGGIVTTATSCRTSLTISGFMTLLGFLMSSLFTDIRVLFFTYGILLGLGRGMSFSTAVISIGYWYRENSSLATGLSISGVGAGMLIHPRLLQAFIDMYGLSGGLQMMGAIAFHSCICGLLLRPSEFERRRVKVRKELKRQHGSKGALQTLKEFFSEIYRNILKNSSFVCFLTGISFFHMAFQAIITFLPDFYNHHGATPQDASLASSILGGGGLISRILVGIIAHDPQIGTILLFSGSCGIASLVTLFIPFIVVSRVGRFAYAFCVGMYLSSMYVLCGPISLEKVGLDSFAYGFGFLMMNTGFVSLIGPPIAVQFRALSGTYYAVFVFAACSLLLAALCGFLSEMFKKSSEALEPSPVEQVFLSRTLTVDPPIKSAKTEMFKKSSEALEPSPVEEAVLSQTDRGDSLSNGAKTGIFKKSPKALEPSPSEEALLLQTVTSDSPSKGEKTEIFKNGSDVLELSPGTKPLLSQTVDFPQKDINTFDMVVTPEEHHS